MTDGIVYIQCSVANTRLGLQQQRRFSWKKAGIGTNTVVFAILHCLFFDGNIAGVLDNSATLISASKFKHFNSRLASVRLWCKSRADCYNRTHFRNFDLALNFSGTF